ncbi:hypothetical protein ACVWWG_009435 [Bradyrhizobium sp. LB7.2]
MISAEAIAQSISRARELNPQRRLDEFARKVVCAIERAKGAPFLEHDGGRKRVPVDRSWSRRELVGDHTFIETFVRVLELREGSLESRILGVEMVPIALISDGRDFDDPPGLDVVERDLPIADRPESPEISPRNEMIVSAHPL